MINVVIVDDESKARGALKVLLDNFSDQINVLAECSDADHAFKTINEHNPELIFLDIEMPKNNGFDLLEMFKQPQFEVIFTTAHGHYAIRAIKFAALDYLMKPIDKEELRIAIDTAKEKLNSKNRNIEARISELLHTIKQDASPDKIAVSDTEGINFISVKDIVRLEADGNYTTIFMNSARMVATKALKDFENLLKEKNFYRVHQSHIINMGKIKKYLKGDGGSVIMSDDSEVEVSRRKKAEFLELLK